MREVGRIPSLIFLSSSSLSSSPVTACCFTIIALSSSSNSSSVSAPRYASLCNVGSEVCVCVRVCACVCVCVLLTQQSRQLPVAVVAGHEESKTPVAVPMVYLSPSLLIVASWLQPAFSGFLVNLKKRDNEMKYSKVELSGDGIFFFKKYKL